VSVVSVVMPTYRAAKWVAASIDSVSAQTYRDVELIVVDDGSPDDTVAVVRRKLAQDFPHRWKVIELGANRGASAARNAGLGAASGAWVQYLDSDDLMAPTKLERQMAICAQAPDDVVGVYSPFRFCHIDDGVVSWVGPLVESDVEGRPAIMSLIGGFRPLLASGLARRTVLEGIGGFDETLRFWECEEITFRLARAGRLVAVPMPEPSYLWRMHRGQSYIGGEHARYRSAAVALGWIDLVLKAADHGTLSALGLTEAERRGVLDECTMWARLLYGQDRAAFRRFVAQARTLDPDVAPTNPGYVTTAARYVGYEAAEGIANLARMPRTLVRKTLQKAGLRAQNGLFEY